jgi:hypothetical protein
VNMNTLFQRGCCHVCGKPLLRLVGARTWRSQHYCSRACRMVLLDFEEFTTLRFILLNSRWSGGAGFRTYEELMTEAVERLAESEDRLAELLIEIIEVLDRDREHQVAVRSGE